MARLAAVRNSKIERLAFDVNVLPDRAELDAALIAQWTAQVGAVFLITDNLLRAEIDDDWDGVQGVEPAAVSAARIALAASMTEESAAKDDAVTVVAQLRTIVNGSFAGTPAQAVRLIARAVLFLVLRETR
jgi:hypothetical protein